MNYYADALDFIHAGLSESQKSAVVIDYAKRHPKAFVTAVNGGDVLSKEDRELADLIKAEKFVNAVKRRREQTGEGLKEAKEYCDQLKAEL